MKLEKTLLQYLKITFKRTKTETCITSVMHRSWYWRGKMRIRLELFSQLKQHKTRVQEKEDEILSAVVTHLEHTFFCVFPFSRQIGETRIPFSLSFSLSVSSMLRLATMWNWLAKKRGGSYNNTSADVARRIGSTVRDRNEIAGSNTFAMEDLFFLEHDDNDHGRWSTLSNYCWKSRYFLVLFVFDIQWSNRSEFLNSIPRWDLIPHFLSLIPFSPRCPVSLILYFTLKMAYILSRIPAQLFYLLTLYTREH